jgi:hypothetical protein
VRDTTAVDVVISHQPDESPPDPSHSGVFYPASDTALQEHLAAQIAETVTSADVYPADTGEMR